MDVLLTTVANWLRKQTEQHNLNMCLWPPRLEIPPKFLGFMQRKAIIAVRTWGNKQCSNIYNISDNDKYGKMIDPAVQKNTQELRE